MKTIIKLVLACCIAVFIFMVICCFFTSSPLESLFGLVFVFFFMCLSFLARLGTKDTKNSIKELYVPKREGLDTTFDTAFWYQVDSHLVNFRNLLDVYR